MTEHELRALRDAQAYVRWLQSLGLIVELPQGRPADVDDRASENAQVPVKKPAPRKKTPKAAAPELVLPAPAEIERDRVPALPDQEPVLDHPSVGTPILDPPDLEDPTDVTPEQRLVRLTDVVNACRKCRLGYERKQAVFGAGSYEADLMFIGEAPGATEDEKGVPFVGRAGTVLTQELEKHGIRREEVFICNIIKCRPPANRDPLPDEIASCQPYLHEQIDLIRPRMLCGLGRYACSVLMGSAIKIMQIRGTWAEYQGVPLFVCLHPSAILHQPNNRHLFASDIAALAARYHEVRGTTPGAEQVVR